jgi:hypothetical protein
LIPKSNKDKLGGTRNMIQNYTILYLVKFFQF